MVSVVEKKNKMIDDLIGRPYDLHGRNGGMNCWGLCQEVARRAGIILPDINAPEQGETEAIGAVMEREKSRFIEIEKPEPFCIVAFAIRRPFISHCGIVLENGIEFLHTLAKRNAARERLDHPYWKTRIAGFYKYLICTTEGTETTEE